MAIAFEKSITPNLNVVLWHIEETEEELLSRLDLDETELADLNKTSVPLKRLEWLAARNALKVLLNEFGQFFHYKDEFGKPHLRNSKIGVSMSHAGNYGAAAIHLKGPVGIDIETLRPKITRIARKFLHPSEVDWTNNDVLRLTQLWAAKEALYKLHGRTQLIFADQLIVENPESEEPKGYILENGIKDQFELYFEESNDLVISVAY